MNKMNCYCNSICINKTLTFKILVIIMKKITLPIKGIHCESCESVIKDLLHETEGILKVRVSHREGIANIIFDEEQIDKSEIKSLINSEGYEA